MAALELHLEPSQISYAKGEFKSGETQRTLKLGDLAKKKPLNIVAEGKFGSTFPNGCHIAEVEVDETYIGQDRPRESGHRGGHHKRKVVSFIDRNTGRAKSVVVETVSSRPLIT